MSKNKMNLLVDVLAYIGMVGLISTGLLLMYILPPGTGGCHGEGGARVAVMGLSRHEWGSVHWYIATGLIVLAGVHVILHWKWVTNTFGALTRPRSVKKAGASVGGAIALVLLGVLGAGIIAAPWVVGKKTGGHHGARGGCAGRDETAPSCSECTSACPLTDGSAAEEIPEDDGLCNEPDCVECQEARQALAAQSALAGEHRGQDGHISGKLTLAEAAYAAGVTAEQLAVELKLPAGTSPQERLGQLRQRHGFSMQDVRQTVARLKQRN